MPSKLNPEEIFDRCQYINLNANAAADNAIASAVAPGAGLKWQILGFWLLAGGGANIATFKAGAGPTTLNPGGIGLAANGGIVVPPNAAALAMWEGGNNEALLFTLSAATLVTGGLWVVKANF